MKQQEKLKASCIMAKNIDAKPINAPNAKIEGLNVFAQIQKLGNKVSMRTENEYNEYIGYPRIYIKGKSKRETYEINSISRYVLIKKSRKKKQMMHYCKKYNFEVKS